MVSRSTLFPFIVGKYVVFRTLIDLAAIAFLIGLLVSPQKLRGDARKLCLSPLVIAVSFFVAVFVLSGFFGVDPHASFWSNFERGEGSFQMLHFYAFFMLLTLLFPSEAEWRKLLWFCLTAAVVVILYGIGAGLNIEGFVGTRFTSGFRFEGSLGNPAYTAPYLLFTICYALILFTGTASRGRRTLLALLVGFYFTFFWLTGTRGAFLGFLAALIVGSAYLFFTSRGKLRLSVGGTLLAMGLILGTLFAFRGTDIVKGLPGSRLLTLSLREHTMQTRLWTWQSAIAGWKERPLLGWGPESFALVFDKHFDTRHFLPEVPRSETWFDRAHSVYFDYLVETGIIGIAAYLGMFTVFYVQLFRKKWEMSVSVKREGAVSLEKSREKTGRNLGNVERALFCALPIAYLVQGLAVFDVLPIYINVFLFLAFAQYRFNAYGNS